MVSLINEIEMTEITGAIIQLLSKKDFNLFKIYFLLPPRLYSLDLVVVKIALNKLCFEGRVKEMLQGDGLPKYSLVKSPDV